MKRIMVLLILALSLATATVAAEESWELKVGAGAVHSPVYEGSSDYYKTPLPKLDVSYNLGALSLSASISDGLGISYFEEHTGLLGSLSLNMGGERDSEGYGTLFGTVKHSDDTRRLLEGTPTVNGVFTADATLGAITPVGILGTTVGYRPAVVEVRGGREKRHQGVVVSAFYMIGAPIGERFAFAAILGVEAMNGAHADAWYSLEEETGRMNAFSADPGLRSTQLVFEGSYMVTDHLGLSILAGETVLLADAAESPFSEKRFQTTVILNAFYRFGG